MNASDNTLNWFEICVTDMPRAKKFYETIFGITMQNWDMPGFEMVVFPADPGNGKVSGALVKSEMHTPSMDGSVIYLNGDPDLSAALDRVEAAGGKVLMPKTHISDEIGYMAFFADSEGNRMALHSNH
ncbi:MAG: VOC family protein [Bacteroidetes bacterium]|nr:VOC family protein [Bacteroidota bacterium]